MTSFFTRLINAWNYLRYEEIPLPSDNRPMQTDVFLSYLCSVKNMDAWEFMEAASFWVVGDWKAALAYLTADDDLENFDDGLTAEQTADIVAALLKNKTDNQPNRERSW